MMPVIYPEDCAPGSWQAVQPACDRSSKWQHEAPPAAVQDPSQRRTFCIQVGHPGLPGRAPLGQHRLARWRRCRCFSRLLQPCPDRARIFRT